MNCRRSFQHVSFMLFRWFKVWVRIESDQSMYHHVSNVSYTSIHDPIDPILDAPHGLPSPSSPSYPRFRIAGALQLCAMGGAVPSGCCKCDSPPRAEMVEAMPSPEHLQPQEAGDFSWRKHAKTHSNKETSRNKKMPNTNSVLLQHVFRFFRDLNLGISWPRKVFFWVWWISCWTSWQFENPSKCYAAMTLVERFNHWIAHPSCLAPIPTLDIFGRLYPPLEILGQSLYFHRCWVALELYFCSIPKKRDILGMVGSTLTRSFAKMLLGPFQHLRGTTPAWSGHGRQGRSTLDSLATLKRHELFWGVLVVMHGDG